MYREEESKRNETENTTVQDCDGTPRTLRRRISSTRMSVNSNKLNGEIFRKRSSENDFIFSERRILLSTPLCLVSSRDVDSDPSSNLKESRDHDIADHHTENNISSFEIFNSMSKDLSRSTITNALRDENRVAGEAEESGYYSICCNTLTKVFPTEMGFSPQPIYHDQS
mmetsp:Transcript_1744/g.2094  ORF Transcript_1744/g.2094 Transcript_1744/m.2094 type:complete len:169 (-) Transcript_1744:79-585(-)|eukprot:CAMPEP_0203664570 /NCGR_PEP_ID=MMETSP0090-20130426/1968_1 /ASSEMBLY_ACC=CAM_ASM_001088 /TAXON_ID=426623 /ORGANISM="Chaetoceros affinis, Strain CCMP159" /LENGTH=168 /DNA_ID=CAMNT_0050527871 /DNA_START=37 /DNA_END=543 /DNA_ORIENTATION=-